MLFLLRDRVTCRISGALYPWLEAHLEEGKPHPNHAWSGMGSARLYLTMIPAPHEITTILSPCRIGRRPGQQGPHLSLRTITEVRSMRLV